MVDRSFIDDSLEKAKSKISSIMPKKEASKDEKKEKRVTGALPETARDMFGDVSSLQPEESKPVLENPPPKEKKESPESLQFDEAENFMDRSSMNHVRD